MDGAPRASAAGPLDAGADGRSPDQWYNKLGGAHVAADPAEPAPENDQRAHRRFGEVALEPATAAESQGGDDTATDSFQTIQDVADRTAGLAAQLSALSEAHERHAEDRARLEAKIDLLCGLLAARQPDGAEPLEELVSRRVTDSMKPFLMAIIDLLELSMRRFVMAADAPDPADSATPMQSSAPSDEPPGGLPDILLMPLEELIEPNRNRAQPRVPDDSARRGPQPIADAQVAPRASRAFTWTPVIPEASKR
jgi:hypothetical protein